MNLHFKNKQSLLLLCIMSLVLFMTSCGDDDDLTPKVPCDIENDFIFENDPERDVDYVIECETSISANVTVEPGTVIEFSENGAIVVEDNGTFKAIGNSTSPIIFRGTMSGQGTWRGIHIESTSLNNILDFCQIENAGNEKWFGFSEPSAVGVTGKCKISNCEISENRGVGVYLDHDAEEDALEDFDNNTISDNTAFPVSVNVYNINALKGNNTYLGNGEEMLRVTADLLFDIDVTFHTNSIPYYVVADGNSNRAIRVSNDIYGPASLTIQEGVTIIFEENSGINVAGNGNLQILGTPTNMVQLKGEQDLSNYWKGIFHKGLSVSNIIKNTVISGAASDSFDGGSTRSSLRLGSVGACCDEAKIKLENVSFENTRCAIHKYREDTTLDMSGVTFTNVESEYCN